MIFLWLLCGTLLIIILSLCIKIHLLQKSMDEMRTELGECLSNDTNVLLSISSADKHAKKLATELNRQLRLLREQRRRYQTGDQELKEAITNISHDLRTPLTAICGYLDLLEQEEKSETVARYLSFIGNRAEAMKVLTEELFRYSVMMSTSEPLEYEMVDVNRVLEESIAAFYSAFVEAGITPVIELSETHCVQQLNRAALCRIFSNILNNALKYSDGDLEIYLKDNGEITFTNTSAILNEVQVGKLFNRFFTVETARNSTGLGLSIAKTLVEEMGGSISATYNGRKLSIHIVFSMTKQRIC